MAEQKPPAGDDGGSKPKSEKAATRPYAVIGAVGPKDAKPEDLDYKVLGTAEAATPGGAKEAILGQNPQFPGLDDKQPGGDGGAGDTAARPTDLQSLVRSGQLWLHADSGFKPQLVEVEQPPPKFKGL